MDGAPPPLVPPPGFLSSPLSRAAEQGEVSANLERLSGLEEEQKQHVRMSEEDPAHARNVAEDQAATLELQGEDESTRKAVEVRGCVRLLRSLLCLSARERHGRYGGGGRSLHEGRVLVLCFRMCTYALFGWPEEETAYLRVALHGGRVLVRCFACVYMRCLGSRKEKRLS